MKRELVLVGKTMVPRSEVKDKELLRAHDQRAAVLQESKVEKLPKRFSFTHDLTPEQARILSAVEGRIDLRETVWNLVLALLEEEKGKLEKKAREKEKRARVDAQDRSSGRLTRVERLRAKIKKGTE